MSDRSGEIRRSYRRNVSCRELVPYRKELCAIPECPDPDEESRGMWSELLQGVLFTLRYLAPATLLAVFWGHSDFLLKVFRQIEDALRSVIYSSDAQSALVLQWVSENSPVQVSCLDQVWRHGWLICGILERSLPGACGGHLSAEASIEHAQTLAEQYLGVQPVFSQQELESTESLSKRQEWRLAHYLEQVRQALGRLSPPVSKPNTPRSPVHEAQAYTLDYVARGMGLCTAQTNRKMCFKLYPTAQQCLEPGEINVLIRGPGDTFGRVLIPPIYGRSQLLRQAFLGIHLKQQYTEGSLPLTHGATYLRTYGKNDMSKTFYIPKTKQDIEIEVSVRRDHTRVTYKAEQDGTYEISITSRGYNLIGSPYRVSASEDSLECNTSTELNDNEECRVVDVKNDRRVVLRIVDFVTEKMVLNDNGSLEKITDEEARKLINNTKPLWKLDKKSKKVKQLDLIEQDLKRNYCARKRFKDAANKIIKIVEVCNSFKATTGRKVKDYGKLEENISSQSEIPDIVHSMIFDKKRPADRVTESSENKTNEIYENDSIETRQKDIVVISFTNTVERWNNEIHNESTIENIDQCNHTILFDDDSIERHGKRILTPQKCVEVSESPENILQEKLRNTSVDDYQKEEQSKLISINPFVSDVCEVHENMLEPDMIQLLQRPSYTNNVFQDNKIHEHEKITITKGLTNNFIEETGIPKLHEPESSTVNHFESLSPSNPFHNELVEASSNDLLTNEYVITGSNEFENVMSENMTNYINPLQSEHKYGFVTITSVSEISNNILTEIDNDQFENHEDSFNTETMKSLGNSITSNPFHSENFDGGIVQTTIESPIKILIETDNEETQVHTNSFIDVEVVERPKTPILKIITGELKDRNDSVYVESNLKLPDDASFDDELRNSNEFLNPFYVNTIYQNTTGVALITPPPPMTDFLIGAPVSLPPFYKAPSPEPDMESIILAPNLEEALNKFDKKLQDVKQSDNAEHDSIFSTPVPPIPTHIIGKRPAIQEKCNNDDSTFYSREFCNETNYVECTNELIKVPENELWDSAYVSIDEPGSSPDSNNNNETAYKIRTTDNDKFDVPQIDFDSMGPAEREIWQKCANDNSELSDLSKHEKYPTVEHKRTVINTILEVNEKDTLTCSNDFYNEPEKKVQTSDSDSITEALAELNDIYKEYYTCSNGTSFVLEPEKEKFQSLEVNFSVPSDSDVDSASELTSDVKRHIEDKEVAAISEVQSYATESFSASRALEKQNTQQNEHPPVINDVKTFGDKPTGNLVRERKKYWDEKIKQIEEMTRQQEMKQRKRKIPSKHLKLNDSIGKRKGKNIAKNFINAMESINCEKVSDRGIHPEHVEPVYEQQTEIKLVDKWKKFWDEKLVTAEEASLFPVTEKKITLIKKSLSPVNFSLVENVETSTKSETGENSPDETLPQPEIHSPIKVDITDEKVFKAFETSPKRFFGNSRRNILDKIDAFLGQPSVEDKKPIDFSIARPNIGIVSSRISLFNIGKSDYDVQNQTDKFGTNMQKQPSISETYLNKISSIDNEVNPSIPLADLNYGNHGSYEKGPIYKDPAKEKNKIEKFRKSTSKSEMDLFNQQHVKPNNFDVHKSCEDLYRVNVKNFVSIFENSTESKTNEVLFPMNHPSSLKDVSVQPQNADNCKVLPEQHHINTTPEKIELPYISNESIEVVSEETPLNDDVGDAPIDVEFKEDIADSRTAHKQPEVEYKERFKKAKLFFQSLEELGSDDDDKGQKLNECEMLLYNQTESSKTSKFKKKGTIKAHSAPTSECEYESNSVGDTSDGYGTGVGGRRLIKISEKFQVEDLFKDVAGDGTLSRRGSFRGIPHKQAVLATFKSMENIWDTQLSSYEMSISQLSDYAKETNVKNAQTYLNEYPYLPKTDPSKYRSRLDSRASGLISRKELLKQSTRPRRNSVPDALRLNERFTANM